MKYRRDDLTEAQYRELVQSEMKFFGLLDVALHQFQDGKAKELHETVKEMEKLAFKFYMASDE